MSVEMITRDTSVVTGKKTLKPLYRFDNFPIFFGCVVNSPREDKRAPLSWAIDTETGVIQLDQLIPLEILYQEQHFDGTGPTWQQYYEDFARYIGEAKPKQVLEIGGGIGRLADIFLQDNGDTNWTIIDPNPMRESDENLTIVPEFFDQNFRPETRYDTVVFSQFMEHVYDPISFIDSLADFAEPDGHLVFAYPNLKAMLEKKYTNAINFEHTMFLTDYFVDYLLQSAGFKIIDKTNYKDHSHFYHAVYKGSSVETVPLENKYAEYKKIFDDFVTYHLDLVDQLNEQMNEHDGNVYLFGAHIFATYLFEFGLDSEKVCGILDNSKLKIGKRLYGYDIGVSSPDAIAGDDTAAVIVKVGFYQKEVEDQLMRINPKVKIIS